MKKVWESIQRGYLRVIEPVADFLVRHRVSPNAITTVGTVCTVSAGVVFATGHISLGGWVLGLTALFDVLDGTVARRTGRSTTFGAFYDSTLDRVADGAVLAGIAVFYATSPVHHNVPLLVVTLAGIIGTFLVSYTRARADSLGIDAKVGVMQRPERVTLLSAPQAFFGLALNGWVLATIIVILTVTSWLTAVQRIMFVHRATSGAPGPGAGKETAPSAPTSPTPPDAGPPGVAASHALLR